jgi:cellulose synthase/poly-beta-1,6-N-acetylglucosamine synthase-like glycosyltransferase
MILWVSLLMVSLLILQDLILIVLISTNFKSYNIPFSGELPFVSILIPCRNESKVLASCLNALESLDYPKARLQVILGNDNSSDDTESIQKSWVKGKKFAQYVTINSDLQHQMNGKANALNQMIQVAEGDVYLFTDADCEVTPHWVYAMIKAWKSSNAGIVTGITRVGNNSFFARMQGIDWWLTLGMVKVMADKGIAVTSMGNNMLISRAAYEAVGGFANIPFSLTEDFEITRQVRNKGYSCIHHVNLENLIKTKAQPNFSALIMQRKRWMAGAMSLPFIWKIILCIQVLFFPTILYLIFLFPMEGIVVWLMKILIQACFIGVFAKKAGERLKVNDLLVFEIYYGLTAWVTILYYFWPSKTEWKGRRY